jgi:hypothetical protein
MRFSAPRRRPPARFNSLVASSSSQECRRGVEAIVAELRERFTNQNGAILELSGRQVGLMANADLSGLAITMK